ncbi:MAG: 3-keto-disaccharide hydrolase [Planctomycetota bacterium]
MKRVVAVCVVAMLMAACGAAEKPAAETEEGFIPLFDGESLEGWKASEHKQTFSVVDGKIRAHGPRSHLFYVGPVGNHDFKYFELKLEVMTTPGSNSGVYFHTEYQERGWPRKGFECQVNATHSDWKKTGSLYNVVNVRKPHHKDNDWFLYHIIVQSTTAGKTVTTRVDGETVVEWTQKPDSRRKLSHGTIALQGHDPKSTVYYRNIRIKPLGE